MATLEIDGVRKTYPGGFEAVKGVSFSVPDGAFAVLVGPSGCGKSTLLRMIAGLETITSGNIRIGGKVVNEVEPADRDIAMVFQNYALYPHMSVYDNMAYGLRNRGTPAEEIRTRVDEAAKLLEIDQLLKRRPRELSGGQRQRVAMGRAIVRKPAAFLFDEPLSNLDAKLRVQMRVEIKKLQQRLGTTSVYVTHDQVEAMTMADLLVVMNGGVADQIGPPREIYQRPATLFVAAFIGSPAMNLVPGTVGPDGASVAVGDVMLPVAGCHPAGRKVMVGLRPEDLIAAADGPVKLLIELVEHLGTDTIVHGAPADAGGKPVVARLPGDRDIERGTTLRFAILPERVHLFDAETGRRI